MSLNDPEYLRKLADIADPDQLWKISPFEAMALPEAQKQQLDMGVALRRYAADVKELIDASAKGLSVVYTKMPGGRRHATQPIPRRKAEEL